MENSYRLGHKGFYGVELLFHCGVIIFSKFDHQIELIFRNFEVYNHISSTSARISCSYGFQRFKISYCDHDVILSGDVNHFMPSMLPC